MTAENIDVLSEQDWRDRISYAELHAYRRGYSDGNNDGRAAAAIWNAELRQSEEAERHWRVWWVGMAMDRRDKGLHARLRRWLAEGKSIGWYNSLVLWLATHPGVRFAADPRYPPLPALGPIVETETGGYYTRASRGAWAALMRDLASGDD